MNDKPWIKFDRFGIRVERLISPEGPCWILNIGQFELCTTELYLRRDWPDGRGWHYALRCVDCRRLGLGCDEHWLCGICQACKDSPEPIDEDQ